MSAPTPAPAKINPDTRRGVRLALGLLVVVFTPSFAMSAEALIATARTFAHPVLAWGAFIAYDVAILAFSFIATIYRHRGERALVALSWLGIFALTALSVWVNHQHAVAVGAPPAGTVMAASFPVLVLFGGYLCEQVAIASPKQLAAARAKARADREAAAQQERDDAAQAAQAAAAARAAERQREQEERDAALADQIAQARAEAAAHAQMARIRAEADAEAEVARLEAAARVAERRAAAEELLAEHTPAPAPSPVQAPPAVEVTPAPVAPAAAPTAAVVDDVARDAEVLRLVAEGLSDSAIAKLPGMPSRATVGRIRARAEAATGQHEGAGDAQAMLELVSA